MDTTAINYGITKLDSMINATMPKVYEFSSEFAEYLFVSKAIICFVLLITLLCAIFALLVGIKKRKNMGLDEWYCSPWFWVVFITAIPVTVLTPCVIVYSIDLILLNYNPEMFIFNNYIIH